MNEADDMQQQGRGVCLGKPEGGGKNVGGDGQPDGAADGGLSRADSAVRQQQDDDGHSLRARHELLF